MAPFSERDAFLHVIEWQIPTTFMLAVTMVFWCAWAIPFRDLRVVVSVIGAVLLCWACAAVILIFLDMLLLPPLFALIRFSHSLSWAFDRI